MKEDDGAHTPTPQRAEIELQDDASFISRSSRSGTPLDGGPVAIPSRSTSRQTSAAAGHPIPSIEIAGGTESSSSYFDDRPTAAKPRTSSSSADIILPVLIYSVIQANPQRLVSDLLFIERFHAEKLVKGESSYCLVNFQAVLEFLLHVDLGLLGLGAEGERLLRNMPDLSPYLDPRSPAGGHVSGAAPAAVKTARDKVSNEVANLALAASKGIVGLGGAVEGGYRMLGGLLARTTASLETARQPKAVESVRNVLDANTPSQSPTLQTRAHVLRRASTPLFAQTGEGLLARSRSKSDAPQRELAVVGEAATAEADSDVRSVSSFSSLLNSADKPSLGDRLASLARFASPDKAGGNKVRAASASYPCTSEPPRRPRPDRRAFSARRRARSRPTRATQAADRVYPSMRRPWTAS
jgi:hypothetical protein